MELVPLVGGSGGARPGQRAGPRWSTPASPTPGVSCPPVRQSHCCVHSTKWENAGTVWAVPTYTGRLATTAARPASIPPTWTREDLIWRIVFRNTRGTWSCHLLWPDQRRKRVEYAWKLFLTNLKEKQGKKFFGCYET